MPRPCLEHPSIVIPLRLTLHPGEDDDLIGFFAACPPRLRAAAVKLALRGGIVETAGNSAPEDDLIDALDRLVG